MTIFSISQMAQEVNMLSEKYYPQGINPTASDEFGEGVSYEARNGGEYLQTLGGKLADIGSTLVADAEERSVSHLDDTLLRLQVLIDDLSEVRDNITDAINEEMQTGRIGA